MKKKFRLSSLVLAVGFSILALSSYASLILVAPEDFQGTGLGNVNTILTIQNKNTESGGVSYNGVADVVTGGDTKTGRSQTQTRSLDELGINSAAGLRVVFNSLESQKNSSIYLDELVLNIYSSAGALLFSSGYFFPVFFADTAAGAGNSGFVFALDEAGAAAAQDAAFLPGSGGNRIGISAKASETDGGFETFFVANSPSAANSSAARNAIPEPATLALLCLGLGGIMVWRRKMTGVPAQK